MLMNRRTSPRRKEPSGSNFRWNDYWLQRSLYGGVTCQSYVRPVFASPNSHDASSKKKKANGHDASCQRKGRRRAQNGSTPPLRHQQTLVFWTFTLHLHCISHSVDAINSYIATKSPLLFRAQVWGDQAQLFATGSFFAGKSYLHRQAPPPHASRRQFCLFSRNTNLVRILHSFWMMMMRESVCVCVYE